MGVYGEDCIAQAKQMPEQARSKLPARSQLGHLCHLCGRWGSFKSPHGHLSRCSAASHVAAAACQGENFHGSLAVCCQEGVGPGAPADGRDESLVALRAGGQGSQDRLRAAWAAGTEYGAQCQVRMQGDGREPQGCSQGLWCVGRTRCDPARPAQRACESAPSSPCAEKDCCATGLERDL